MNKFEARSTLGSEAVPVFNDDGELTEWLHRDNYTVEELELMNFDGKEKPVINKDGVKIVRDGRSFGEPTLKQEKLNFYSSRALSPANRKRCEVQRGQNSWVQ